MKTLEELVNEYGQFKTYKLHAYDVTRRKIILHSLEDLESIINEVISQRLNALIEINKSIAAEITSLESQLTAIHNGSKP